MTKISVLTTPNPLAMKFVLQEKVKTKGKSSYRSIHECKSNFLASELFNISGVDKLHFFKNSITVTKIKDGNWDTITSEIQTSLESNINAHDPNYVDQDLEAIRRSTLPPKLKQIEEILDREIRPTLQFDGGDVQLVELVSNCLVIKYQGACGSCPSATGGTLRAIQSVLANEFDPEITVIIDPESK